MALFSIIHDKALPITVRKDGFSWCPTMDLLAVISKDGSLWIYRADGQRIWSFPLRSFNAQVKTCWSRDGKFIVAASKTFGRRLFDVQLGKVIGNHQMINSEHPINELDVQAVNWVSNLGTNQDSNELGNNGIQELLSVDVSKSLPKLPPLPNLSLDHILRSKLASDSLYESSNSLNNFLVTGYENGSVSISLNSILNSKTVQWQQGSNVEFLQIESVDDLTVHYIISKAQKTEDKSQYFILPLETSFSNNEYAKEVIASSTRISFIVLYLLDIADNFESDCKAFVEFHTKIVNVLDEEAAQESKNVAGGDNAKFYYATSELYELLLTGMMSDSLKSWLENTLGKKNLKKWSKLGNTCVDQIKYKIFSSFIPAGQRLIISLSKLKSVVSWKESVIINEQDKIHAFGLESKKIDDCIAQVKTIMREIYKFVADLNDEQKLFNCFINWLTTIIESLSDDDKKDLENDDLYYSVTEISEYITNKLNSLDIFKYIEKSEVNNKSNQLINSIKQIDSVCQHIFEEIKKNICDSIKFGANVVEIGSSIDAKNVDIKCEMPKSEDHLMILIQDFKQLIEVYDSASGKVQKFECSRLLEPYGLQLKSVQFINDRELLVLAVEPLQDDKAMYPPKFVIFTMKLNFLDNGQQSVVIDTDSPMIKNLHFFNINREGSISLDIDPELITVFNRQGEIDGDTKMASILSSDMHRYIVFEY
ncbi:hypothetical protein DASC09_057540 [Saccharomycopsis crataegensis]|uniref:Anaphase-promoting complex subunit 4 n=1 Tax=Saccharomycopsis crataegensis TaxID=43959 RepID=A0AAV5QUZ2_9ASCO|nr:hypothetical protein DASC09_057540 [Saccharomycopsis crataegensis]